MRKTPPFWRGLVFCALALESALRAARYCAEEECRSGARSWGRLATQSGQGRGPRFQGALRTIAKAKPRSHPKNQSYRGS
jgi:hypothetical protein